ncbi:MAG: beta-lactamase domain protein [Thermoleophilia bacterium]|nr:beta-lactamase domain protein [Thermoleophilia bacterium]
MIIERTESPHWTSNSYLVADREGGHAILIDGNGVTGPLIEKARELGVTVDAIFVTHWHVDHVAGVDEYVAAFSAPVHAHAWTKDNIAEEVLRIDATVDDGDELAFGDLRVRVLYTPGHSAGQVSLLVNDSDVFTADVLFKGTVGGNFAPGNTGYADHRASVERLLELPPETRVHPGHTLPTTIGDELEQNPFVRIWRGVDPEGTEQVTAMDREATLILWAPDYDGSDKAWVRFTDTGEDGITGGSKVVR